MIPTMRAVATLAATAVLGTFGFAALPASAAGPGAGTPGRNLPAAASTISDEVKADLLFMVQEERLAEDVYTYIANKHHVRAPFTNIAVSEQRHQDAVGVLLDRYSLTDPSAGMKPGVYDADELQKLYDDLIRKADKSLSEAFKVGVHVEKTDIADLKEALGEEGLPADVKVVYERLMAASENHLEAFTRGSKGGTGAARAGNGFGNGNGGQAAAQRAVRQGRAQYC